MSAMIRAVHCLQGGDVSLVVDCTGAGMPRIAYWGPRLPEPAADDVAVGGTRALSQGGLDLDAPLRLLPQVGQGFPGQPGLGGARGGEDWVTDFRPVDVRSDGGTLALVCEDAVAELQLRCELALDPDTGVLRSVNELVNLSERREYRLDWLAALVLPVPVEPAEVLTARGRWAREFEWVRQPYPADVLLRENRTGRTSHEHFPGLVVGTAGFGERRGCCYGFHLGWSGNHRIVVEHTPNAQRQVQLGELALPGELCLKPGGRYRSPAAYAAVSAEGLGGMSALWHDYVRGSVVQLQRPRRPVHLNTWEAFYFDHDVPRLKRFADTAAELGIERFVLDDGWFRGRNDDTRALGDWYPDSGKYPDGLQALVGHVRSLGMEFGLWVEPEMVNEDSDLFRAHPDWVLAVPGRRQPMGRNQLVLDLARPEVIEYLFSRLDSLLGEFDIDYLKWDMNRELSQPGHDGRASVHAQTHALYELLDRLRRAHPQVEIESCASGGGRADFEILRRTTRVWTSDCNDAVERQVIQRGFSLFFPPEIMGAHVGPQRAHTTGRTLDFSFQGGTALFGHLGFELDVTALDDGERQQIRQIIDLYKRHRALLHGGRAVRLECGDPQALAHGVVARDGAEALFCYAQIGALETTVPPPLRLAGLPEGRRYRARLIYESTRPRHAMKFAPQVLTGEGAEISAEWACRAGLQLPVTTPETLLLIHLQEIDGGGA